MMTEDFTAIQSRFENGASAGSGDVEPYLVSLAISAKRIADALDDIVRNGTAINVDVGNR
jgi:hypothetical protein